MKVIDKRSKKTSEEWKLGDVICMWDSPDDKIYEMICETNSGYGLVVLDDHYDTDITRDGDKIIEGDNAFEWLNTISDLRAKVQGFWKHAEKVNAELVIKDKDD